MPKQTKTSIPVLTDMIGGNVEAPELPARVETLIAELQTEIAASAFELTERLIRGAIAEMEGTLFEQISKRLRQELPELIDKLLRQHLAEQMDDLDERRDESRDEEPES